MYLGELQEPTGRFLKNMHKGAKHNQNMGKSILVKYGATAMVDQGESAINLKCARGWQSNK
eukprot:14603322-Ditylum_brightwellii.AAC.1